MTRIRPVLRKAAFTAVFLAASAGLAAGADETITPIAADNAAARDAKRSNPRPKLANTPAAAAFKKQSNHFPGPATTPFQSGKPRYPGDLTYQGGPFLDHAQSHAVYVLNSNIGCKTPACWGNPEDFLRDLGESDFIHVADQYVNRHDDNRYTDGSNASVPSLPTKLLDSDVLAVLHGLIKLTHQNGYNHMYHVFLPPGTDVCFDSTSGICYSPDNPNTFIFCAYHGFADFADIGHVLYSVEPYQNVGGCNLAPGSPNGPVVDSTDNTLSHEVIEIITDPDLNAWFNTALLDLLGAEIGDSCDFVIFLPQSLFFDPPVFKIGDHKYAVQAEYSNSGHACLTTSPGEHDDESEHD